MAMDVASLRPTTLGFRIESFLDLQHWKPLAIDEQVHMTTVSACPADGAQLQTLCTLLDGAGARRVRLGCCPRCGHVTYVDRPTREWIEAYYLSTWDSHEVDTRMQRREARVGTKPSKEKTAVKIAVGLDVDRARPVCEIGCGYGESLGHLAGAGFSHLVGTEASDHRAAVARRAFGVDVFTAPFESARTQQELERRAPFSIVYSHHVLEHTYHPDEVLAAASRLQGPGDYLIVSVPHHEQEPSMGVLLFLPHLHSFTRASLVGLAGRHGYELLDDSLSHPKNLNLAFRKSRAQAVAPAAAERPFDRALEKYVRVLGLGRRRLGRRRLWWHRRADQAGQVPMFGTGRIEARHWAWVSRRHGYESPRCLMISNLGKRFTSVAESPLEIQFRDELALLYK